MPTTTSNATKANATTIVLRYPGLAQAHTRARAPNSDVDCQRPDRSVRAGDSGIGLATSAITNIQKSQGAAGLRLIAGLAGALWSASGYVAAFMRASNAIYDIGEGRPVWKTLPTRVVTTLVLLVMLVAVAIAVTFTGGLAKSAGSVLGVGSSAIDAWNIAKWPVILLVVIMMFAFLYWAAPNVKQSGFRWVSPGGIVGVLLWIAASAGFALYVANFGSYNKTYGALGGVIVFLVWLWLSNVAILLCAELNAELERGRRIEAGHPDG